MIGEGNVDGNFKDVADWNCRCDEERPCRLKGRSRKSPCSIDSFERARFIGVIVGDDGSTRSSSETSVVATSIVLAPLRVFSVEPRPACSAPSRPEPRRSELVLSGPDERGARCEADELTAGPSSSDD